MEDRRQRGPERPHHTRRRLRWGKLLVLLVLVGALGTGIFWGSVWFYDTFINPPHVKVVAADDKIKDDEKLNERINILLLGIDDGDSEAAESEPKRTDAIILLSFDPKANKVAVLSIPAIPKSCCRGTATRKK